MKIAILKPDHLGDVVLAIPAVRRIVAAHPDREIDFLCAPGSAKLVRRLFPEVRPVPVTFPHLDKTGASRLTDRPALPDRYEFVYGLRTDDRMNDAFLRAIAQEGAFVASTHDEHETWSQKLLVERLCGAYSRSELFFGKRSLEFPARPRTVGLCVAAGFVNNRWDTVAWLRLGRRLLGERLRVKILGGPLETDEVRLLRELLGLAAADVILGGDDFDAWLARIEQEVDVLVATDSGTAHLASLVKPILSVFGPSPHRRYAPFGRHNRLIRRDVECSPCCQFARTTVNACLTRECLAALEPDAVLAFLHDGSPPSPCVIAAPPHERLVGASHVGPGSGAPRSPS